MTPLTPDEIDALPDYTNAQMVKLIRSAIAELASSPEATVTVAGRSYTMADMGQLRAALRTFMDLAAEDTAAATDAGSYAPVVQFQEPQ